MDFPHNRAVAVLSTASEANGKAKENDILYPLLAGGPFDYAQGDDGSQGTKERTPIGVRFLFGVPTTVDRLCGVIGRNMPAYASRSSGSPKSRQAFWGIFSGSPQ